MVQEILQRSHEPWRCGCNDQPLEFANQLTAIIIAGPLQLHKKLLKNSTLTILRSFDMKQIGKIRKLSKWVLRELTANKKKLSFWSVFSCSTQWTISQFVTCDEEWILYNSQGWPARWLEPEEAPKHYPKPRLPQKKGDGRCSVFCCWSDLLQLSDSQRNHYI